MAPQQHFVLYWSEQRADLTWTVFLILWDGPGYSEEYRSVRKRELMSVDFPKPDSPAGQRVRDYVRHFKTPLIHHFCWSADSNSTQSFFRFPQNLNGPHSQWATHPPLVCQFTTNFEYFDRDRASYNSFLRQVTFICIVLFAVLIVSKQLHTD